MALVVRTETWHTRQGIVSKAVVRTPNGRLVGATNQTAAIDPATLIIGKR